MLNEERDVEQGTMFHYFTSSEHFLLHHCAQDVRDEETEYKFYLEFFLVIFISAFPGQIHINK